MSAISSQRRRCCCAAMSSSMSETPVARMARLARRSSTMSSIALVDLDGVDLGIVRIGGGDALLERGDRRRHVGEAVDLRRVRPTVVCRRRRIELLLRFADVALVAALRRRARPRARNRRRRVELERDLAPRRHSLRHGARDCSSCRSTMMMPKPREQSRRQQHRHQRGQKACASSDADRRRSCSCAPALER